MAPGGTCSALLQGGPISPSGETPVAGARVGREYVATALANEK